MVRSIKLLQYQMIAYWRRAFLIRGRYDSNAGFLFLILLGFTYRYVSILNNAAKSISNGNTENLSLLLGIVFVAWILPVLESQSVSAKTAKFLHLPLTKTRFTLINLSTVFLLPTSIIAAIISLAAIYPLAFSKNVYAAIITLFIFVLLSAFSIKVFVNLLKIRFFRIAVFLSPIILAAFFFGGKTTVTAENNFSPNNLFAEIVNSENQSANIVLFVIFLAAAFLLAFLSSRQTISASADSDRKLNPQILSRIKLPAKFSELIKKDFLYSWKIFDCWLSLSATIFYAIILIAADLSFESFSVAISCSVMLSGSLAFNNFGLENASSIERLSLLPIKAGELTAAKNKAFALVVFSQIFFLFPLVFFRFGVILLIISILKTISIVLLYTAWGNDTSIKYPFRMNLFQLSFGGSLSAMLYGILIISLLIVAPEFLTAENVSVKLIVNIFSAGICFLIYKFSLRRTSKMLFENWESIKIKLS